MVNRQKVSFKLDTGAAVTAISERSYRDVGEQQLVTPKKIPYGPSRKPLTVVGQFTGEFAHKEKNSAQDVYVVKGLETNLLGLPAIEALQLAVQIDSNEMQSSLDSTENIKQFPSLFQGLGSLGDEYEIKLKEGAIPLALNVPRNVSPPLCPKVKEELERIEELGVISKIEKPTSWCAGMVVVPKKQGSICICVDLKPLNQSVRREIHPIPKVKEMLAQISGARVFSKLDANSGFWQIPLAEKNLAN